MELVVATSNRGKLREIAAILQPLGIQVVPAAERGFRRHIPETGTTFAENALLKARTVAQALGLPALADDSGLVVEALDGAPGVHSARYAGPGADDQQRNAKLLAALQGLPPEKRGAAFVCVMACCRPDGACITAEGRLEGRIATAPAGKHGFGYDPVFQLPQRGLTLAQLTPQEKNDISHRARALAALSRKLVDFLNPPPVGA